MPEKPIIPGPAEGPDMAEACFRNGAECMQKRVLKLLDDLAAGTIGISRNTLLTAREMIDHLDPLP